MNVRLNVFVRKLRVHVEICKFFKRDIRIMASDDEPSLFQGLPDRYHGITVDSTLEWCHIGEFHQKLQKSLERWQTEQKRGIWFKVGIEHSDWVPILAQSGFNFHHAKHNFVTMFKWISNEEECRVPKYCHTMLGAGAIVMNEQSEILVVKEKYYTVPHWKLPGGYIEAGENIVDAAIREVFEETNIATEFESLVSLRHAHNWTFDCSDLYFIVSLKPTDNMQIKICEKEISESQWMSSADYLTHPHIHDLNKFFVERFLDSKKRGNKIECKHGIHQILQKPYTVYYLDNMSNSS